MPAVWKNVLNRRMLSALLLGFSAGLPLLLIGQTLKAWLKQDQVDIAQIGFFGLIQLPYSLKFLWAPVVDRFKFPFLDRRRGWILFFQLCLAIGFACLAVLHPSSQLTLTAVVALTIAFLSASQDIVIDAHRREILNDSELAFGSSLYMGGYRVATQFVAGALALWVAQDFSWQTTYFCMAGFMGLCMVFTLISPAPIREAAPPKEVWKAFIEPLIEYFRRIGAIRILAFVLLYKIGDQMASELLTVFYQSIGYTLKEIAAVTKLFGFWAILAGGFLGGTITLKIGITRSLWIFGIFQGLSTAGFAVLSHLPHSNWALAAVVAFENLTSGMGGAAFIAFMGSLCNVRFTATQYALLSSFTRLSGTLLGGSSGVMVKYMGWSNYFIFCALLAIPGLLMLRSVIPLYQAAADAASSEGKQPS